MSQSEVILDPAVLDELRMFDGDAGGTLLDDLIKLYLNIAPASVATIQAAAIKSDLTTIEKESHSLKSSSGNLGAKGLQAVCQSLEKLSAAGNAVDVLALMPDMEAEFQKVCAALKALQK